MVPVLSEQMTETEPSVSTSFSDFTKTFFFARRFAANDNPTLIVSGRPSGTFARMMQTQKMKAFTIETPSRQPEMKKMIAIAPDTIVMNRTSVVISFWIGVFMSGTFVICCF